MIIRAFISGLLLGLVASACTNFDHEYEAFCAETGRCAVAPPTDAGCAALGGSCEQSADCCGEGSCVEGACSELGLPHSLKFMPEAPSIRSGECVGPLLLTVVDDRGRPVPVASNASHVVTFDGTYFDVFQDAACTQLGSFIPLADGPQGVEARVWLRTEEIGSLLLKAALTLTTGEQLAGSAYVQVLGGLPASLEFDTAAATGRTTECIGPMPLRVFDFLSRQTLTDEALALEASLSSDSGVLFAGVGCETPFDGTFPADAGVVNLYLRDQRPGEAELVVRADALDGGTAAHVLSVRPGPPQRLRIVPEMLSVIGGTCSGALSATLEDLYGNPTQTDLASSFSLSGATSTSLHPVEGCDPAAPLAFLSLDAGAGSVNFRLLSSASEALTLQLSSDGGFVAGPLQVVALGADSRRLTFTGVAPMSEVGCLGPFRIEVTTAASGDPSFPQDVELLLDSSATSDLFFTNPTCTGTPTTTLKLPANQTFTDEVYLFATTIPPVTRTLTVDVSQTSDAGAVSGFASVDLSPGPPASLYGKEFSASPDTCLTSAGSIGLRDEYGNRAVAHQPIDVVVGVSSFNGTSAPIIVSPTCAAQQSVLQIPQGKDGVEVHLEGKSSGQGFLHATTDAGFSSALTAPLHITPGPADHLSIRVKSSTLTEGRCYQAMLYVMDAWENPTPAAVKTMVVAQESRGIQHAGLSPTTTCGDAGWVPLEIPAGSARTPFSIFALAAGDAGVATMKTQPSLQEAYEPFDISACAAAGQICSQVSCCPGLSCNGTSFNPTCCAPGGAACTSGSQCCSKTCNSSKCAL